MQQHPTGDELEFIKQYLEIPFLLDILEDNITKMKGAEFRLGDIFLFHLVKLQDKLTLELAEIRKQMRNKGMKVIDTKRTKVEIRTKYLCRGYTGSMVLLLDRVKADLSMKLCELLSIDINEMRSL
ncbi:hypothetical protein [Paenibacillus donghaensis]|uniref:Uncharacterized protein n=1 Tax=Paenibacillus donghaensis TaxID=414771 RepID=A0A2Z2KN86_9BACL|nr:hypothetical protein [Paenibacillus donghaensis]ASA22642.1 hypothetical protein B9T62_18720 [Paenibacillus donghaensis]